MIGSGIRKNSDLAQSEFLRIPLPNVTWFALRLPTVPGP